MARPTLKRVCHDTFIKGACHAGTCASSKGSGTSHEVRGCYISLIVSIASVSPQMCAHMGWPISYIRLCCCNSLCSAFFLFFFHFFLFLSLFSVYFLFSFFSSFHVFFVSFSFFTGFHVLFVSFSFSLVSPVFMFSFSLWLSLFISLFLFIFFLFLFFFNTCLHFSNTLYTFHIRQEHFSIQV